MLMENNQSCLLLIDVQEKLTPFVLNAEALIARCQWLLRLAAVRNIPTIISEQYPNGLGATIASLHELASKEAAIEKVHFSCWRESTFRQRLLTLNKKQLILIGIEAHVCVLQTAIDLIGAGYEVFVVVDAVSSRHEHDYRFALKRMKTAGVQLVTSEMVFFEWVGQAGTPEFKALSKSFLQ